MQVKVTKKSPTLVSVAIAVDEATLKVAKEHALNKLSKNVKVAGFRAGKAPASMVEKNIDPAALQSEFIDEALNHAYGDAMRQENLRPVLPPKIELTKFVPFTTVEFTAEIEVLGPIKLADYKSIKKKMPKGEVTADEVETVIGNIQRQTAQKTEVERAAKNDDEVSIDFEGTDEKGQEVSGAKGTDYPLLLGSKQFIPGFEDNLIGLKAGDEKTFTLKFPKDYGVKALASRDVTFKVTINKVLEVSQPKADDELAKKAGPFQTLAELKADIKKQLSVEKERSTRQDFEAAVIKEITDKSKLDLPAGLIEEQVEAVMRELQQNVTYRGMTMQEYLASINMNEAEQREKEIQPEAERRLKAGLVLSAIAEAEQITVTEEEINSRVQILKNQYKSDETMQAELDKPEAKQDIAARLLTEKTIAKLISIVTK